MINKPTPGTAGWDSEAARAGHPVRPVVLAVDDNPMNLELLAAFLQDADCEVIVATSGLDALETAANVLPDLVLLDVMMPGMDGYEVCRRLKANPATRFVPVVLVTSLEQVDDRVRGLEAGTTSCPSRSTRPSW